MLINVRFGPLRISHMMPRPTPYNADARKSPLKRLLCTLIWSGELTTQRTIQRQALVPVLPAEMEARQAVVQVALILAQVPLGPADPAQVAPAQAAPAQAAPAPVAQAQVQQVEVPVPAVQGMALSQGVATLQPAVAAPLRLLQSAASQLQPAVLRISINSSISHLGSWTLLMTLAVA